MTSNVKINNPLTLPKSMRDAVEQPIDFEIEDGRIVLTPASVDSADDVRLRLDAVGLNEGDAYDAVVWARKQ